MTAVFCLSGVAAVVFGCWWERRYERRFEHDAARDLAPVSPIYLEPEDAAIVGAITDNLIEEIQDSLWMADLDIDWVATAGGLR